MQQMCVKLELPKTSMNPGNNTMQLSVVRKPGIQRKHFVLFKSILWDFSVRHFLDVGTQPGTLM